ncbi:DUF58 domain-containing protein [Pedosphaera parvula]|uniref:DUF58 domain-containing protein n=1 Tax=Pedosphaera parvula (strain Ellin514) TaxID=320771 RepID=B9XGD9_PEDPL|nr:DUF58 domain-containing protein [Pedosphaera parvula]EEF60990.1 protein of unknown function DUF58 [Pedosphaera parvula Ellin514]
MIVPRSRLLLWVALIVLPFSLLGAVEKSAAPFSFVLIAAMILAALLDALLGRNSLAGIELQLPLIVRMSKDRDAKIEIRIKNNSRKPRRLRLGLPFPREIHSPLEEMEVNLPKDEEWSRMTWSCQPIRRGNYRLHSSFVEGISPLGFWGIRRQLPTPSEIRVYPNLLTERKSLAALFMNRGAIGIHAQRQIGKGRDFEKLREYIPGDGYDEIHWKATAKRGRPVTKIFQVERTQEIYVIIDSSRLSSRLQPSARTLISASGVVPANMTTGETLVGETSMLERFVTAALVLGLAAEKQGDLFGLLTFSDKVGTFLRARNGNAHYNACRDALYTLQPQSVTPDFDELSSFIRLRLRRRALLVFLTALDDPLLAQSFVRNMDLICRQHLILVNMIQPPGVASLFSRPNVTSTDDIYQQLGGHLLWNNLRELEKVLKRRGVRFSLLENERMSSQLVSQYLGVKQRQLL